MHAPCLLLAEIWWHVISTQEVSQKENDKKRFAMANRRFLSLDASTPAWDLFLAGCGLPGKDRHKNSRLAEVLGLDGICKIGVSVSRTYVVVSKILDDGKSRHSSLIKWHVVGGPDPF